MFQSLIDTDQFQDALFLIYLDRHMGGDGIRQATRFIYPRERGNDFRRDFLVQFDVLIKLVDGGAYQHIQFPIIGHGGFHQVGCGSEIIVSFDKFPALGARCPFYQNLDGAVRKLEQLQDIGKSPYGINIFETGIIIRSTFLCYQQNLLVAAHSLVERPYAFFPAHE